MNNSKSTTSEIYDERGFSNDQIRKERFQYIPNDENNNDYDSDEDTSLYIINSSVNHAEIPNFHMVLCSHIPKNGPNL